jgi:hypothetical protein
VCLADTEQGGDYCALEVSAGTRSIPVAVRQLIRRMATEDPRATNSAQVHVQAAAEIRPKAKRRV